MATIVRQELLALGDDQQEPNTDREVIKNRSIIEACYNLSMGEHRIVNCCQLIINDRSESNSPIKIRVQDYAEAWGVTRATAHNQISDAVEQMWHREIRMQMTGNKKGFDSVRWLQRKMEFSNGEVELYFSDKLYQEMYEINEDSIVAAIFNNMVNFKCNHTHRVYENLLSRRFNNENWEWDVGLDSLREILVLSGSYKNWSDLKKYVISVTCGEINKFCEFNVNWEISGKEGRTITRVKFVAQMKPEKLRPVQVMQSIKTNISPNFKPNDQTLELLESKGYTKEFIAEQRMLFIIYFTERGDRTNTWQVKFINHCAMKWGDLVNATTVDAEAEYIGLDREYGGDA